MSLVERDPAVGHRPPGLRGDGRGQLVVGPQRTAQFVGAPGVLARPTRHDDGGRARQVRDPRCAVFSARPPSAAIVSPASTAARTTAGLTKESE